MKIQLERTLSSCPSTLTCSACATEFTVPRIRALLCSDQGLIHGDLCPNCIKTGESGIQRQFKAKAIALLQQNSCQDVAIATYRQVLINQEIAAAAIAMPQFYHWWLKGLQIYAQETQELQKARFGLSDCPRGNRKYRIIFQPDPNVK